MSSAFYCILVVFHNPQKDKKHFNRGALLNIGVVEALNLAAYDCIILHDVDKFPEDTRNLYMCSDKPLHLISKQRYVNKDYREYVWNYIDTQREETGSQGESRL